MSIENIKNYIPLATWKSLYSTTERPYYDVAGKVYYNKLEAIRETDRISKATGIGPWFILRFNCFNSLSQCDFSKEPQETYDELCVQRAKQLRDKYKYIRLWYSGGVDSHTTLKSFYRAGVAIDEIVCVRQENLGGYENYEANLVVKPNLQKIQAWFPNTKITDLNYFFNIANNDYDSDKFQSKLQRILPGWHLFRSVACGFDIKQDLLDQYYDGNNCELVGEPKPSIIKKNGKWYSYILDNTLEGVLPLPGLELFHLSRDFPQIYIKQCHMLKNNYEKLLEGKTDSYSKEIDKDQDRKNVFLQRFNEWDINDISIKHNKWAKNFKVNGDNPAMVLADNYLTKSSEFSQHYKKFELMFQKEVYDQYKDYFDLGLKWKNTKGLLSLFWCLDEHGCLTADELWPTGFGVY